MADGLASKLAKLRSQVQEFKKERGHAPVIRGGPRVVSESLRLPPSRPLFRGAAPSPSPRPLFRAADPPVRPLFRGGSDEGRPLIQSNAGGGPIEVPPRYPDEAAPSAKRRRVAPSESPITYALLLQQVPADYTSSTLTELHEALLLDPESMAAMRFLRVNSQEGAATPTRSVVLRYRDQSSASRALEVLNDHPVVSETGETVCIEAKWHDVEAAGNDAQPEAPQDVQWAAPVEPMEGEAVEEEYQQEFQQEEFQQEEFQQEEFQQEFQQEDQQEDQQEYPQEHQQPYDPEEMDENAAHEKGEDHERGDALRNALTRFIQDNNLDEGAQDALWDLGPEDQEEILREGPCTGANPSALLMSRIRRLAMERAAFAPPVSAGDVERFVQENDLDAAAAATLRECDPEITKRVVAEGRVTGRNPSAMVASRIRRAQQEHQSLRTLREQQSAGSGPILRPVVAVKLGASADPTGAAYAPPAPPMNPGIVERFLRENNIDADAASTLRECDPEVQKRVVAEGQVTGRNPSAMVVGRIRRAQQEIQSSGAPARPVVAPIRPVATTAAGKLVVPIRPVVATPVTGGGKPVAVLPPRSIQQSISGPSTRPVLPQIRGPPAGQRPASLPPAQRANGAAVANAVASGSPESLEPLQPLLMALGAQALLGALGTGGNIPAVRPGGNIPAVRPGGNIPAVRPGGNIPSVRPGGNIPAVRPGMPTVRPAVPARPLFTARVPQGPQGPQPAAPKLLRPKAAATSRRP